MLRKYTLLGIICESGVRQLLHCMPFYLFKMSKEINTLLLVLLSFSALFCIAVRLPGRSVNTSKYHKIYTPIEQQEAFRYKVNKVCVLRNYNHHVANFPRFVYIDIEMFGNNLRIDLDDFEPELVEENGKKIETSAFEILFLDQDGKKTKSTASNNNSKYLHIGIVVPATEKSKQIQLRYWDSSLGDTLLGIGNYSCEIR